jgi:hypothetical protein
LYYCVLIWCVLLLIFLSQLLDYFEHYFERINATDLPAIERDYNASDKAMDWRIILHHAWRINTAAANKRLEEVRQVATLLDSHD